MASMGDRMTTKRGGGRRAHKGGGIARISAATSRASQRKGKRR